MNVISPGKFAVKFGIIYGLFQILEFVVMYVLNIDAQTNPFVGIILNILNYFILPFIFIYIAANNYKTEINNGYILLSDTLKVGVTTSTIAALLYGVFYLIFNFIFPEFQDELLEKIQQITIKQNPKITTEQLNMSMKYVKMFMNPYLIVPFTVLFYCLLGIVHSLIVGAIIKKDKPVF